MFNFLRYIDCASEFVVLKYRLWIKTPSILIILLYLLVNFVYNESDAMHRQAAARDMTTALSLEKKATGTRQSRASAEFHHVFRALVAARTESCLFFTNGFH